MRAKTILTLLFLLSLGIVVALFVRSNPTVLVKTAAIAPPREVLVASAALPSGTLLRGSDVRWQPVSGLPATGYFVRPGADERRIKPDADEKVVDQVLGGALRVAVGAGKPIPFDLVVMPGDRDFLQVVLAPGERAVAIPVATGGAGIGLLRPGDRADVILTQNFKEEAPLNRRSVSETVIENLRVLAVDPPDAKTGNPLGRTVTFEATPEQARTINVAGELGKLSVVLRSRNEEGPAAGQAAAKPSWAGDVSPALQGASAPKPAPPASAPAAPTISIIRGGKHETVKSE